MNPPPDDPALRLERELTENFTDGASVLARRAVRLVQRYAHALDVEGGTPLRDLLLPFVLRLQSARPSMFAIARVLHEWQLTFDRSSVHDLEHVDETVTNLLQRMEDASLQTVRDGVRALAGFRWLMTHSDSSTVRRVIEAMNSAAVHIVATESNPGGEGVRFCDWLREHRYDCRLVADAEAMRSLHTVDVFVVGADAVLRSGDIVNKVGTRALAEAATTKGVPVFVLAESFKNATGSVVIERTSAGPLFDVTPGGLITQRIGDNLFSAVPG